MHSPENNRPEEVEHAIVQVMGASLAIRNRSQFFRWSQGGLQRLIPHDLLLCSYQMGNKSKAGIEIFSASPLTSTAQGELAGGQDSLLSGLQRAWMRQRHEPLLISPEPRDLAPFRALRPLLDRYELANCAVHGLPPIGGAAQSFFCFARTPVKLTQAHTGLLRLTLPYLHLALLRVAVSEPRGRRQLPAASRAMTMRESQILNGMRDGKSNREIGELLRISPLTAKNHVHSILTKLAVRNRAQAVSHAIALGLLESGHDDAGGARAALDTD